MKYSMSIVMPRPTGLRPTAPAEFIVIRIIHQSAGVGIAGL
jgi:hypothetical protein